ncbi:peptide chain release factor RF-2 [Buchnera aphidicola (Cinara tujafilina)]|uniref:Peptide chain release factor 2 n=1 Tax=Buchnera aphidicola (Cinara tujafilina) TaxID=261317 RepID=F7WZJ1_9GAMM|nr:peptide chain release factor 2 [Buchnera aphidicola]AEH39858.1 peptide chain release factor RF-2 [Buchnera aphidicola (Cinara tujafilina)]
MLEFSIIKKKTKQLNNKIKYLTRTLEYKKNKKEIKKINNKLKSPVIWRNNKTLHCLQKEKILNNFIKKLKYLIENIQDIKVWIDILSNDYDNHIISEINIKFKIIEKIIKKLEIYQLFSNHYDQNNCYIDIQSGSGGLEAQDWAKMLLRMYIKWADIKNFSAVVIEESIGEIAGIKSATIKIKGKYAFGWCRTESGIHRLVRKSPFDMSNKRHTSFCSIFIYPEIKKNKEIILNASDLRIDVYRASGAGGQHVNCTESAVRITHVPTGISTQCQSNRSQHKNKNMALKQLKSKLYILEKSKINIEKKRKNKNKLDIGWGNQIRSYILDNSLIKDLRTGIEQHNTKSILDGNLSQFIEQSLKLGL